ncbi:hypothetical protein M405DRAFT_363120 [Rhizopogon salebrosus TDB-379]|nr:hypothetical protein M405DRAFT_363120 [Rhizopogon salebrosus TDB-379]
MLNCECLARSGTFFTHLVLLRVKVGTTNSCAGCSPGIVFYHSVPQPRTIQEEAPDFPLHRVELINGYLSQRSYSPLQSAFWRCCAPYGGGWSVLVGLVTRASESTNAHRLTSLFFAEPPDFASSHIRR